MATSLADSAIADRRTMRFLLAAVFVGAIDLSVISTLLLPVVRDLEQNTADLDRYAWVVIGYLLAYVAAVPIFGRLLDAVGLRAALWAGLTVFLVGTAVTVMASSLDTLILGRVIQGAGGGAVLPIAMAYVTMTTAPVGRLGRYGLVAAVDTLGWVLGPVFGALVVALDGRVAHSWRLAFLPNVLVLAGFVIVPSIRRRVAPSATAAGGGWASVALLTVGISLLNLALASAGQLGAAGGSGLRALGGTSNPLTPFVPLFVGAGLSALAAFWLVERSTRQPAIPRALRVSRPFLTGITVGFAIGGASAVAIATVPVYAALRATTQSPSSLTAILLTPHTAATAVAALMSGRVEARLGLARTIGAGLALTILGGLASAIALDRTPSAWGLVPGLVVLGIGIGLSLGPILALGLAGIPEALAGTGASVLLAARLLGTTMGISAITAFGTWRIQDLLSDLQPLARLDGESTADYFVRQAAFIDGTVVPEAVRAISEIYLLAAALGLVAALALWRSTSIDGRVD